MTDDDMLTRTSEPQQVSAVSLDPAGQHIAAAEEVAAFQAQFVALLERRTAIYTMGDSTSVPTGVALDVLRSVSFVLGIDPGDPEIPERLLTVDLESEFRTRLADVERKVELSGALWRAACAAMPPIPSVALHDTIAAIGEFPRLYDFRSMAHEIPVMFDYPLCHPVPETLLGVDYINEYLRRLLGEFDFLGRFEPSPCMRVLERASADYVELLANLYEPVATNAIGRACIGLDPMALRLTPEEQFEIARRLAPLGEADRGEVLIDAAIAVCDAAGKYDEAAREYLCGLVPELLPRIDAALHAGGLGGVFV